MSASTSSRRTSSSLLSRTIPTLALAALCSCATARVVDMEPGRSGTIAVHDGIIGDARSKAADKMKENCSGKNYTVVKEGESVVGHDTTNHKGGGSIVKVLSGDGGGGDSSQRDATEWRIKYKCGKKS